MLCDHFALEERMDRLQQCFISVRKACGGQLERWS